MYKKIFYVFSFMILFSTGLLAQDKIGKVDFALDVIEGVSEESLTDQAVNSFNALSSEGGNVQLIDITDSGAKAYQPKINETIDLLDVKEESLEDVLDIISDRSGIVFIISESIPQKVSIFIENISVWDLLKIILQQHELAYYRTNGAVHIMSADVFQKRYGYDFPLPFPTRTIAVAYANLENLITLLNVEKSAEGQVWVDTKNRQVMMIDSYENSQRLQGFIKERDVPIETRDFVLENIFYDEIKDEVVALLTKGVGRAVSSEAGTKISVTDTEGQLKKILEFLDERDQQVVIPFRIKIVRIALNEEHLRGVDWEAIVSDYQKYPLMSMNSNGSVGEKISLGTVTREDYEVLIEALDTVGNLAHLISFQTEAVLNQEKSVDIETNDPFWSLRPGTKGEQNGPVVLDPNGFEMQMNLLLKKDQEKFSLEIFPRLHWMKKGLSDLIFVGEKKVVLDFKDDEVVVIGGLIRTEEIAKTRKVPLLGDLPMVGGVFRRERKKFENTEYMIFLKPETGTQP